MPILKTCNIKDTETPIWYFEYQPERGRKYLEIFLKDYNSYIHTDAYSRYNGILGEETMFVLYPSAPHLCECIVN